MNLDQRHAMLATEGATVNQCGAIIRECARLGITDRAERIALCATLTGLDTLDSTRDLTEGQAGRLVKLLAGLDQPGALVAEVAAARWRNVWATIARVVLVPPPWASCPPPWAGAALVALDQRGALAPALALDQPGAVVEGADR